MKEDTNYTKQYKLFGVGINDVTYKVKSKDYKCPYYSRWCDMLRRCYYGDKYSDVEVCPEWKYLSNFIEWVDSQPNRDWIDCHLDKDLLGNGKLYSPETCCFISGQVNTFISGSNRSSKFLTGVSWHKRDMKFYAQCNNPLVKYACGRSDNQFLGYHSTELEAHLAWQAKKHEYACQLALLQDDPRVAEALINRYMPA